jgi:hypothetical protein
MRINSVEDYKLPDPPKQILDPSAQPFEAHDPIPDDKLALFELPRLWLLVGTWQGPGTIAELRRGIRS